jgi:hypothetical protein
MMGKRDEARPYEADSVLRDLSLKAATPDMRYEPKHGAPAATFREAVDAGTFPDLVQRECDAVAAMLIEKNRAYGNSALDPVRIFSQADRLEQLKVRIDDKLSRIAKGHAAGEEVVGDLIGYLVLLRIAERKA